MFLKHISTIVLYLSLVLVVTGQSGNYFKRSCPLDRTGRLRKCKIYVENRLDFNAFRQWTSRLRKIVKVELDVTCGPSGRFNLPWPMKAKGLVKLNVNECTLEGFSSEYNKVTNLEDDLEELALNNCVGISSLDGILEIIYKPVSQEFDCGQQTVHTIVRRNISYVFPKDKEFTLSKQKEQMLLSSADKLLETAKQKNYICRYPNLKYIDDSISRTRSKLHLRLMTAYSEYPNLQTYLIADNGYRQIPQELVDWRTSFPALRYLDMSYNYISEFNFLGMPFVRDSGRTQPLSVDLSHNSIRIIPLDIAEYLKGNVPIIIDLTGNPMQCDCNFLRYKQYVMQVINRFPKYRSLSNITCYSTRYRRKIRITKYNNSSCALK